VETAHYRRTGRAPRGRSILTRIDADDRGYGQDNLSFRTDPCLSALRALSASIRVRSFYWLSDRLAETAIA